MKKILILLLLFCTSGSIYSQEDEKQTNEGTLLIPDSLKSIIPVNKQSLLRDVDLLFNTRLGFDSQFRDGKHLISSFTGYQLRLELKGKIHDKVYFRFRDRYTRTPVPGNIDNVSRSVDVAFLRIDLGPRTDFSLGKLCADWGGYEFDFNPIDILAYNDIIENSDNFLAGAGISHTLKDNKNSFSFQVLNSRTNTYEEQYGALAPPNINPSKFPLAFVSNWRGSFFNGKFETTYSYSFFNEAQGAHMNYFVFGNKYKAKNFLLYYDFHYSKEGLDRKGIISSIINSKYEYAALDALYIENWVRAEYLVTPKVNLILTVMNSNHRWKDNPDANGSSKLSTSFGIIPTVEYLPFKDLNMRLFVGYVARKFNYTSYAEQEFGVNDYTTGQLTFGIIAPLLVF